MCGITGIYKFSKKNVSFTEKLEDSIQALSKRGPDARGSFRAGSAYLGHARLSIIDTSNAANQPFSDASGRFTIVFNGEFFNYQPYRRELEQQGIAFRTHSDTEVLLQLYIKYGAACLEMINGFFALAIYDAQADSLFLARDRYGKKPLVVWEDTDCVLFASEMKALLAYGIPRKIDIESLYHYLQLNYIPQPHSILQGVRKLPAGHYIILKNGAKVDEQCWYKIEPKYQSLIYSEASSQLIDLMTDAVRLRMIADVPLGAFLSGGIDSSVIVALASQQTKHLNTFSIGYKDHPFFDETRYAEIVAKKYQTNHTVFKLGNDDLLDSLFSTLEYLDEPFADSSALAVNILSHHTRKQVTVALSGDGADELFAGYNKHAAHLRAMHASFANRLIRLSAPLLHCMPQSRNNPITNKLRQLARYSNGLQKSASERYWHWCSISSETEVNDLLTVSVQTEIANARKQHIVACIEHADSMNEILLGDVQLVLQGDMLVKVDLLSMANSLEVRCPFLDYRVVNFAFGLPDSYKIDHQMKKKIVQDAFRNLLPEELYCRPKHGFEVPLLDWLRNDLSLLIKDDLLADDFIVEQGLFNCGAVKKLLAQLHSSNAGDAAARVWALVVFQYWYKKTML